MECPRSTSIVVLALVALTALFVIEPSRSALAVIASAPTCEYGGNTCKTCEEFEVDPQAEASPVRNAAKRIFNVRLGTG